MRFWITGKDPLTGEEQKRQIDAVDRADAERQAALSGLEDANAALDKEAELAELAAAELAELAAAARAPRRVIGYRQALLEAAKWPIMVVVVAHAMGAVLVLTGLVCFAFLTDQARPGVGAALLFVLTAFAVLLVAVGLGLKLLVSMNAIQREMLAVLSRMEPREA